MSTYTHLPLTSRPTTFLTSVIQFLKFQSETKLTSSPRSLYVVYFEYSETLLNGGRKMHTVPFLIREQSTTEAFSNYFQQLL